LLRVAGVPPGRCLAIGNFERRVIPPAVLRLLRERYQRGVNGV
jgi:hypothetical protein